MRPSRDVCSWSLDVRSSLRHHHYWRCLTAAATRTGCSVLPSATQHHNSSSTSTSNTKQQFSNLRQLFNSSRKRGYSQYSAGRSCCLAQCREIQWIDWFAPCVAVHIINIRRLHSTVLAELATAQPIIIQLGYGLMSAKHGIHTFADHRFKSSSRSAGAAFLRLLAKRQVRLIAWQIGLSSVREFLGFELFGTYFGTMFVVQLAIRQITHQKSRRSSKGLAG